MSSPPHPLFHLGMTGWWKIRNEETAYYKPTKPEEPVWPPKFWKFILETVEQPKTEAAFVDSRRFARIRLVNCAAGDMRNTTPLKENGPDPVIDKDILTEEWLTEKLGSKRVPVKALLLDQANISGIGNWVGDELLYHARIHPEQYSNTLSKAQIKQLHASIHHVCGLAVSTLSDSSKYPEEWLFKHRWGKGKKDDPKKLPNGASIKHITVGGRTSDIVPSVQKKTGPVAGDLKGSEAEDEEADGDEEIKPESKLRRGKKSSAKNKEEEADDEEEDAEAAPPVPTPKGKKPAVKREDEEVKPTVIKGDHHEEEEEKPPSKKRKANTNVETNSEVKGQKGKKGKTVGKEPSNERLRSARVSRNGT